MPKAPRKNNTLHSFAMLLLCIVIAMEVTYLLIHLMRALFDFDTRFSAALIAFVGTVWATLYVQNKVKRREIEARQFPEKSVVYDKIITLITELMMQTKTGKEISEDELLTRMLECKKGMLIWGNADLINSWNNFEISYEETSEAIDKIFLMDDVLLALRKDLGHNDRNLKRGSLWALFIIREDKEKFLGTSNDF